MKILLERTTTEKKISYQDLIELQKDIEPKPAVILAEIEPVITFGRRSSEGDFILKRSTIEEKGISFLEVDRGGKTTYHGPGQLMIFLSGTLEQWVGDPMGVRTFVNGLLECGKLFFEMKGLKTEIQLGSEAGLFDSNGAKVASVGISIKRTGVKHGLCINLYQTTQSFYGIRPCGLDVPLGFLYGTKDISFPYEYKSIDVNHESRQELTPELQNILWTTVENDFRKVIAKVFTKSIL